MDFNKVIIWGFPLHTHTHSYIHGGWVKGFKHLGYETHWFHEKDYPNENNFDYNNTLFITEGYADNNIPINSSSIYFVHICINPEKYLNKVKRLIEIRYLVDNIKDYNYNYVLDKNNCIEISKSTYYEKLTNNGALVKYYDNPIQMNYECIYTCWATDLLPEEIKEENIDICNNFKTNLNTNNIYWCGSYDTNNNKELLKFVNAANENNIKFVFNNPWSNPLSYEEVNKLTMQSIMSPDIRCSGDLTKIALGETGTCHKSIGYIPCRILKAISYGLLGITNSKHVYELLDKKVIYNYDEYQLCYDALKEINNKDLIKEQMKIVRENHTYINRINDLLKILEL
jgi:hypothetical protein